MIRWRRWLITLVALPPAALALFLLAAWIGSSLPRNADWTPPAAGITIMV